MKYLIAIVLTIAVIIFVIIRLLSGGGSDTPDQTAKSMLTYANSATSVRMVIDNPTQYDGDHRIATIVVNKDAVSFTMTQGYEGTVINERIYPNNSQAYAALLLSLERSGGYTRGNSDEKLRDERGYCALGTRYSYDIVDGNGNETQHFWSTSCKDRTFEGKPQVVQNLFRDQVPDFSALAREL